MVAPMRRFRDLPHVRVTGDPLGHPVYWLGVQWAVTRDGVECRNGTYVVARDRIHEAHAGWTWESHLAEKGWAYMDDFAEAMAFARRKWPRSRQKLGGVR